MAEAEDIVSETFMKVMLTKDDTITLVTRYSISGPQSNAPGSRNKLVGK